MQEPKESFFSHRQKDLLLAIFGAAAVCSLVLVSISSSTATQIAGKRDANLFSDLQAMNAQADDELCKVAANYFNGLTIKRDSGRELHANELVIMDALWEEFSSGSGACAESRWMLNM